MPINFFRQTEDKRMTKLVTIILLSISFSYAATDKKCQAKLSKNLCAKVEFDAPISRRTDAKFKIGFYDLKGNAIPQNVSPMIKLWMVMKNGHEHGSDEVEIKRVSKHEFAVSNVWFMMLGKWKLIVEVSNKGQKSSADIPVCVRKDASKSAIGNCH